MTILSAVLYVVAFALVCVGLGASVVTRLDRAGALGLTERLAVGFSLGTVILYFLVSTVGAASLAAASLWSLSAAALVAALPGLRAVPWRALGEAGAAAWRRCRRDPIEALLWLVLLGTVSSSLLQGMAPPNDYDSLMYHLSVPLLDVERGWIAPPWERALPHGFFPQLTGNLYRLVLGTMGELPLQMVTGLFGIAATAATAMLAGRLGAGRRTCLVAALAFAASRVVVWEMATAEVEVPLALFTVLALCLLLAWRQHERPGLMVLLGLMLGAGMLVKLQGAAVALAVAVPLLMHVAGRPRLFGQLVLGGAAGLALFSPHALGMWWLTGNPLFPLLNHVFTPGAVDFFGDLRQQYGIGRDLVATLLAPWALSTAPMQHFDGMVLGAPYFLALAPLALLARPRPDKGATLLLVAAVYYLLWFHLLSQQVRFLVPVFSIFAVWSAFGAAALGRLSAGKPALRGLVVAILLAILVNQGLFVGIYSALRLPPALGLTTAADYHSRTPTLTGAFFAPCRWLRDHLQPGERVLSLIVPHSYYCPQAQGITRVFPGEAHHWLVHGAPPPMERAEFIRRFADAGVRWVIVPTSYEKRRNDTGVAESIAIDLANDRFGVHLAPALAGLEPVRRDPSSAIYDGPEVLARLQEKAR